MCYDLGRNEKILISYFIINTTIYKNYKLSATNINIFLINMAYETTYNKYIYTSYIKHWLY